MDLFSLPLWWSSSFTILRLLIIISWRVLLPRILLIWVRYIFTFCEFPRKFEICSVSFTKVTCSNMQIEEKRCLPLFGIKNRQPYNQCCEALYESIFKTFMWKRISLKIQRDRDQPRPSSSNGLEMAASWSKGVKTSLQMSSKLCGQLAPLGYGIIKENRNIHFL